MNLKSKKQGFGYFQWSEQLNSESTISEFLYWLEEKTKKFDETTGYEKNSWASIRMICRYTKLHHVTVRKAIKRKKENFDILEVPGRNNSRLFCFSESPNADYIRSKIKKELSLANFYQKYNSAEYVKKILLHPKFDRNSWLIYPRRKLNPIINRVRKKSRKLDTDSIFGKTIKKRKSISRKNKKL